MESFDVIVVGAGPGGEVAAGQLAQAGLDVAIVETELVGGECSFYACMPPKALLWPGELLAQARQVPGLAGAFSELLARSGT
jgi:dihydrolipoamide dehydrogenase